MSYTKQSFQLKEAIKSTGADHAVGGKCDSVSRIHNSGHRHLLIKWQQQITIEQLSTPITSLFYSKRKHKSCQKFKQCFPCLAMSWTKRPTTHCWCQKCSNVMSLVLEPGHWGGRRPAAITMVMNQPAATMWLEGNEEPGGRWPVICILQDRLANQPSADRLMAGSTGQTRNPDNTRNTDKTDEWIRWQE